MEHCLGHIVENFMAKIRSHIVSNVCLIVCICQYMGMHMIWGVFSQMVAQIQYIIQACNYFLPLMCVIMFWLSLCILLLVV